jgi:ABC-2 type transport system permease protein
MTPGVLAQSVLFAAIFFGIAVIWEKDLGIVQKLLVSPAYRSSLVLGKAISAGFRGLVQAVIVHVLALLLGVDIVLRPGSLLGTVALVILGAATFSTFSLLVACWVKTRERFMGVGQVLTMPLFFASSAIYPLSIMPPWLRWIAAFNPLTYMVDGLRILMIQGSEGRNPLAWDFLVLLIAFGLMLTFASRAYPSLAR